jgi:hypothetical protein
MLDSYSNSQMARSNIRYLKPYCQNLHL